MPAQLGDGGLALRRTIERSPTRNSALGGPFQPMDHRQDADATKSHGQDGLPNAIYRVWGPMPVLLFKHLLRRCLRSRFVVAWASWGPQRKIPRWGSPGPCVAGPSWPCPSLFSTGRMPVLLFKHLLRVFGRVCDSRWLRPSARNGSLRCRRDRRSCGRPCRSCRGRGH